ncbi:glutaredoxin 2 [Shewanella frigidimarina]|uniref:glutaredoxin 2 n=1 Tax=Shewanella frigidimarina TaxID=56812 RepID=UPI003D78E65E
MKLYAFNSCPYCTRVRALIGLKQLACEVEFIVFGGLPAPVVEQLTKFTVPVLQTSTPMDEQLFVMAESLDIFKHLDQMEEAYFTHYNPSPQINELLSDMQKTSALLCYPRMPYLGLPELATLSALNSFIETREQIIGMSFGEALQATAQFVSSIQDTLRSLLIQLDAEALLAGKRRLGIDDIIVFSELRNLTMIAELQFTAEQASYLNELVKLTHVPLYPQVDWIAENEK